MTNILNDNKINKHQINQGGEKMTKFEIMEIIQEHRDIPKISDVMSEIIQIFTENEITSATSKMPESIYDAINKLKKLLNLESESDDNILTVLKEIYLQENDI